MSGETDGLEEVTGKVLDYEMRLYKTAYTLAVTAYENYSGGPGATSTPELQIRRTGTYGTGDFPPIFAEKEDAEKFRLSMQFPTTFRLVEVEYRD